MRWRASSQSSTGGSKTTTNTHDNDTGNWLLGRLATATVTSTAPAVASQAPAKDITPDAFDFSNVSGATPNAVYEANAIISGFNRPLTARVSGGTAQIRKSGAGKLGKFGDLRPGDTLNIRMNASSAFSTALTATLIVGTATADWRVTTVARDDTPDPFDFADVTNAENSAVYEASEDISEGIAASRLSKP